MLCTSVLIEKDHEGLVEAVRELQTWRWNNGA